MAKKDKKKGRDERRDDRNERSERSSEKNKKVFERSLKESTLKSVWGIALFVLSVFFLLAAFNKGGLAGGAAYLWLNYFLGYGYYLVPAILLILSLSFFGDREQSFPISKSIGGVLFIVSGLGLFNIISPANPLIVGSEGSGGVVGALIANPLLNLFDYATSTIALIALMIISLLVIYDASIKREQLMLWNWFRKEKSEEDDAEGLKSGEIKKLGDLENKAKDMDKAKGQNMSDIKDTAQEDAKTMSVLESIKKKMSGEGSAPAGAPANIAATGDKLGVNDDLIQMSRKAILLGKPFVPPPLSLLQNDRGKPDVGDIKANANIIKRTLQNFGIDVEMDEVSIGPSVTRYALKPAEGVKLSKILGLQNNLSLALAAHPLRIEAPIPGKSLVGIEIPNTVKTTVGLGSLLAQEEYQKSEKPLLVALGKGISGKSYFDNLAKMPHLLIAGATGSGKSVTIHTVITSLLYRNSPQNLRLILIDPKRVELTLYNKIPHLLTPVITEAKKAILSLKWAAKEMDRRYNVLEKHSVRDLDSYHKNVLMPALEKRKGMKESDIDEDDEIIDPMPYIVIVIDELADIMQAYPRELEAGIVRLAQMSRAVGIHLILSTQRPSVNVITGLIKANVPSRIALQVASQIDSRTILDMRGAEELLGAGDMLYLSGEMSTPRRIQSAYITEAETKKVVKYLIDSSDSLPQEITLTGENVTSGHPDPVFSSNFSDDSDGEEDDLYEDAKQTVIEAGKASTSYIQRKLRVGYARAARLMDILEERGVIGPADGAKPREILNGGDDDSSKSSVPNVVEKSPSVMADMSDTMGDVEAAAVEEESVSDNEDEDVTGKENDSEDVF